MKVEAKVELILKASRFGRRYSGSRVYIPLSLLQDSSLTGVGPVGQRLYFIIYSGSDFASLLNFQQEKSYAGLFLGNKGLFARFHNQ